MIDFIRRILSDSPKESLTSDMPVDVESMTVEQAAEFFVGQIPRFTQLWQTFGSPALWPVMKLATPQVRELFEALYDRWSEGGFDLVPGVAKPGFAALQSSVRPVGGLN